MRGNEKLLGKLSARSVVGAEHSVGDAAHAPPDSSGARRRRGRPVGTQEILSLYTTAVYTGMRQGELAGLRWDCVDLDRRLIMVKCSFDGPTKSGESRMVPILDPLLPVLRRWSQFQCCELVFPNRAGRMHQPSARVFQEVLHRVLEAAGFSRVKVGAKTRPYITFHGLRHYPARGIRGIRSPTAP